MSEQTEVREALHQYALSAPKTSGVYLWRDEKDIVIYVGKAKSLKNRLSSYFASKRDIKTRILVSRARRLEYIQTDNEYEALLLENNLIKKYKPRYNINLKDGKTYPVLKITNERYPRLFRTRRVQNDGGRYFGPFPNVPALDDFLSLVKRTYTLRQCKRLKKREPCLYFHIGRCSAPCADKVSESDYRKEVDEIALLLEGDLEKPLTALKDAMKAAAAAREFEKAARIRDGIQAVQALRGQNIVEDMDPEARDYIGWAAEGALITFTVLKMRGGKVVGRDLYRTESLKDDTEILPEFLMAYYTDPKQVPPHIFVVSGQGHELAEQWFADRLGVQVAITAIPLEGQGSTPASEALQSGVSAVETQEGGTQAAGLPAANTEADTASLAAEQVPGYGSDSFAESKAAIRLMPASVIRRHRAALAMARFNAKEDASRRVKELGDFPALEELQKVLSLDHPPHRIEGFDIAHLHGKYTVASLISFKDGNPDKKNYRIFRLRTTDGGIINDYASMREAVARRYTRLVNEGADLRWRLTFRWSVLRKRTKSFTGRILTSRLCCRGEAQHSGFCSGYAMKRTGLPIPVITGSVQKKGCTFYLSNCRISVKNGLRFCCAAFQLLQNFPSLLQKRLPRLCGLRSRRRKRSLQLPGSYVSRADTAYSRGCGRAGLLCRGRISGRSGTHRLQRSLCIRDNVA